MKIVFDAAKGQFAEAMAKKQGIVAAAGTGAIQDAALQVKREGRAAIARAGFSVRWQNALRVNVYPQTGASTDATAYVFHNIKYAGIFERGGTIKGSRLLWLPLPAAPLKIGRERVTPRLYIERIGPLHAIRRPGKRPLLAAYVSAERLGSGKAVSLGALRRGARSARRQQAAAGFGGRVRGPRLVSLPLFVGIPSVRIRARFGLAAIFEKARRGLAAAYLRHLKDQ